VAVTRVGGYFADASRLHYELIVPSDFAQPLLCAMLVDKACKSARVSHSDASGVLGRGGRHCD